MREIWWSMERYMYRTRRLDVDEFENDHVDVDMDNFITDDDDGSDQ